MTTSQSTPPAPTRRFVVIYLWRGERHRHTTGSYLQAYASWKALRAEGWPAWMEEL